MTDLERKWLGRELLSTKTRQLWLRLGDKNNGFFSCYHKIYTEEDMKIRDEQGNSSNDQIGITQASTGV